MRFLFMLTFCFCSLLADAQQKAKLIEGGIGFNGFSNLNSRRYDASDIGGILPLSISFEGLQGLKWNESNAHIREYNLGLTFLLRQGKDLSTEWLGSIAIVGQFQRNIILSATYQSLTGEKKIDSTTSIQTLDHNLMLVSGFNDLFLIRPALGWRKHLNRRLNMRADLEGSFGKSILHGFDVTMYSGTVERTIMNGKLAAQQTKYDTESDIKPKFIELPSYLAWSINASLGIEYRVFEQRSIFFGALGSIGKQFQILNDYGTNFGYLGGEFRLISRF